MNEQPSSKRLTVSVTGVKNLTPTKPYNRFNDIDLSNRPELAPRYLCIKLCDNKDSYIEDLTTVSQVFNIIQNMKISDYFKDNKEYNEDIRCLLFHDIICHLMANNLKVSNRQALYDLLEI